MAAQEEKLVAITPAMREGSGLVEFSRKFPERYYDVAIAEQHAVTLAAGMACDVSIVFAGDENKLSSSMQLGQLHLKAVSCFYWCKCIVHSNSLLALNEFYTSVIPINENNTTKNPSKVANTILIAETNKVFNKPTKKAFMLKKSKIRKQSLLLTLPILLVSTQVTAKPWLDAGDMKLRHELQLLSDAGLLDAL
ncbi:1-deoxy-D-xylulose-5-phosphate synthase [Nymphon striatum]|nr:1-deoxy-D-xylulose-5-phosphate synthase [Nymphon striatum]